MPSTFASDCLSVGTMTTPEPELARAINEVNIIREIVEELRASLRDFTDRMLVGDVSEGDKGGVRQATPAFNSGVTGQLRRAINDTSETALDARSLAAKLRQIG